MIRIGHAWDTHKLVENRKLILGGVEVDNPKGLLGHSDADVVLRKVCWEVWHWGIWEVFFRIIVKRRKIWIPNI